MTVITINIADNNEPYLNNLWKTYQAKCQAEGVSPSSKISEFIHYELKKDKFFIQLEKGNKC